MQNDVLPDAEITGTGAALCTVTKNTEEVPLPQVFAPATDIFPVTAPTLKSTVMELVPAPDAIVAPEGNVQLYEVALAIAGTVYTTPVNPGHTVAVPEIEPAAEGNGLTVTANAADPAPVKHPLDGVTEIFPDTAAAEAVTTIAFVPLSEVMVNPAGNDQV